MVDLAPDQIVNLSFGILILIPAFFLYRNYRITEISDFLLFSGVYVAGSIGSIASVFVVSANSLWLYQVNVGMINLTFFLLFFHGLRVKFEKPPMILRILGIGYFAFLTILILLWQLQAQPESTRILGILMDASAAPNHPNGAGISVNGTILYSTSYYIIGLVYWIFVTFFLIWVYVTVEMVNPTQNIIRSRMLWVITWTVETVWGILLLPIFPQSPLINILLLLGNILVVYIAYKYPESLLLSNDQIVRYQGLYDKIMSMDDDEEFGMSSLVDYMKSLPDDVID